EGVSAVDKDKNAVTFTVSGSVNTANVGKYELVYKATDSKGISGYATRQVLVLEAEDIDLLANGTYNFKFADADVRHTFFAAAERYLLENMIGGIPYYVANSYSLLAERVELPVDVFIPSYGWGTRLATLTKDDSQVKDVEGNPGKVGEYTNRTWDTSTFGTLNYWTYDDSVSDTYLSPITGGFYRGTLNEAKNGWEFVPDLADDVPTPVNGTEKQGKVVSKTWQIKLREDLKWAFNDSINTTGFDMTLTAEDYYWTYREALNRSLFRAISGGGDLVKEIEGAEDYNKLAAGIYVGNAQPTTEQQAQLDAAWDKVGIKKVDDYTLEFTLKQEKSEFDVFYAVAWPAMHRGLYEKVGTDYGKDEQNIASSGEYVMTYHERDKLTKYVKNDKYPHADETMWTGLDIIIYDDVNVAFQAFLDGKLESAGVPNERIPEFIDDARLLQTPDATTWRLNINGLKTVEAQQAQFPGSLYVPEPILGYAEFRRALYHVIDRKDLQQNWVETSGVGTTYFSDAYYVDPESGIPYRSTEQGQAIFDEFGGDTWAYNLDAAKALMKTAVAKGIAEGYYQAGTANNYTEIELEVRFMNLTTSEATKLRADFVKESFEKLVDDEHFVKIVVNIKDTPFPNIYYDYQMLGNFDIAIGGISGSALDASSFLDVFSSDNRGGFTINWGFDSSLPEIKVTWTEDGEEKTEIFSYDAIVSALNGDIDIVNGMEAPLWVEEFDNWPGVVDFLEDKGLDASFLPDDMDEDADGYVVYEDRIFAPYFSYSVWVVLSDEFMEEDLANVLEDFGFVLEEGETGDWGYEAEDGTFVEIITKEAAEEWGFPTPDEVSNGILIGFDLP
ncbi:MAG: ABC transporter substrate-binding protein, partial [Acholeplasmataceae bacterium]